MGEDSDSFYVIEEGTVSVEASFVDIPLAQRAVSFPVNVASPSNGWCGSRSSPLPLPPSERASQRTCMCYADLYLALALAFSYNAGDSRQHQPLTGCCLS